ncbi:MAG: 7-carboxy-7-deazaguanine synthase QueE [Planctomycetes bacterium]|nr:7-carboxy-7-deazaguanine synthase QueE [Planctomycetota bacterium]
MKTMVINEIFYSLQGEGFLTGVPSVFVRLAGCPLQCRWCDTKYAWDQRAGEDYNISDIVKTVLCKESPEQQWPCKFIVITGGEPMINPDLPQLVRQLKTAGKHITIETAGIAYIPDMPCDLMSISPKLSNSVPDDAQASAGHKDSRLDIAVLQELIDNYEYQLKFVVDSQDDLPEIRQTIEKIGDVNPEKVMLMPQAATRDELLAKSLMAAEMCKQTGYAFSQRLQILLWNNQKGK